MAISCQNPDKCYICDRDIGETGAYAWQCPCCGRLSVCSTMCLGEFAKRCKHVDQAIFDGFARNEVEKRLKSRNRGYQRENMCSEIGISKLPEPRRPQPKRRLQASREGKHLCPRKDEDPNLFAPYCSQILEPIARIEAPASTTSPAEQPPGAGSAASAPAAPAALVEDHLLERLRHSDDDDLALLAEGQGKKKKKKNLTKAGKARQDFQADAERDTVSFEPVPEASSASGLAAPPEPNSISGAGALAAVLGDRGPQAPRRTEEELEGALVQGQPKKTKAKACQARKENLYFLSETQLVERLTAQGDDHHETKTFEAAIKDYGARASRSPPALLRAVREQGDPDREAVPIPAALEDPQGDTDRDTVSVDSGSEVAQGPAVGPATTAAKKTTKKLKNHDDDDDRKEDSDGHDKSEDLQGDADGDSTSLEPALEDRQGDAEGDSTSLDPTLESPGSSTATSPSSAPEKKDLQGDADLDNFSLAPGPEALEGDADPDSTALDAAPESPGSSTATSPGSPPRSEKKDTTSCIEDLRNLLVDLLPQPHRWCLEPFGSQVSGTVSVGSDIDVTILPDGREEGVVLDVIATLETVFEAVSKGHSRFEPKENGLLTGARVPVLKMKYHTRSGSGVLDVDLSVNNTAAVLNSHLLKAYVELNPKVKVVMMFVKQWAKEQCVSGTVERHLSNYGLLLMVLYMLQVSYGCRVLPIPDDLSAARAMAMARQTWTCEADEKEMLFGFFKFYTKNFVWGKDVVSIRPRSRIGPHNFRQLERIRAGHMIIEDPITVKRNVADVLLDHTNRKLRVALRRGYDEMINQSAYSVMCAALPRGADAEPEQAAEAAASSRRQPPNDAPPPPPPREPAPGWEAAEAAASSRRQPPSRAPPPPPRAPAPELEAKEPRQALMQAQPAAGGSPPEPQQQPPTPAPRFRPEPQEQAAAPAAAAAPALRVADWLPAEDHVNEEALVPGEYVAFRHFSSSTLPTCIRVPRGERVVVTRTDGTSRGWAYGHTLSEPQQEGWLSQGVLVPSPGPGSHAPEGRVLRAAAAFTSPGGDASYLTLKVGDQVRTLRGSEAPHAWVFAERVSAAERGWVPLCVFDV